jgi:hypothetical protein
VGAGLAREPCLQPGRAGARAPLLRLTRPAPRCPPSAKCLRSFCCVRSGSLMPLQRSPRPGPTRLPPPLCHPARAHAVGEADQPAEADCRSCLWDLPVGPACGSGPCPRTHLHKTPLAIRRPPIPPRLRVPPQNCRARLKRRRGGVLRSIGTTWHRRRGQEGAFAAAA